MVKIFVSGQVLVLEGRMISIKKGKAGE